MRPPYGRSPVAQLAEHLTVNQRVVGSSPTRGACAIAAYAAFLLPEARTPSASVSALVPFELKTGPRTSSSMRAPVSRLRSITLRATVRTPSSVVAAACPSRRVSRSPSRGRGCPARRGTSRRRSRCDGQAVTRIAASSVGDGTVVRVRLRSIKTASLQERTGTFGNAHRGAASWSSARRSRTCAVMARFCLRS